MGVQEDLETTNDFLSVRAVYGELIAFLFDVGVPILIPFVVVFFDRCIMQDYLEVCLQEVAISFPEEYAPIDLACCFHYYMQLLFSELACSCHLQIRTNIFDNLQSQGVQQQNLLGIQSEMLIYLIFCTVSLFICHESD